MHELLQDEKFYWDKFLAISIIYKLYLMIIDFALAYNSEFIIKVKILF